MFARPPPTMADQQRGDQERINYQTGGGQEGSPGGSVWSLLSGRCSVVAPCGVWRKIQSNQVVILVEH